MAGFSRMSSELKRAVLSHCTRPIARTIESDFSGTIEAAMTGVARIRMGGCKVQDVLQPIRGIGTAFCIYPGLLATASHNVCWKDCFGKFHLFDIWVDAVSQGIVPRTIVKPLSIDTGCDLALLQLPDRSNNDFPLMPLDLGVGSQCRVGEKIFSIGHADTGSFGTRISSIHHPARLYKEVGIPLPNPSKVPPNFKYMQSGLGTRSGMSGSPVLNTSGLVVGIHSSATKSSQPKVSHEIYSDYLFQLLSWHCMNEREKVFVHGDGADWG